MSSPQEDMMHRQIAHDTREHWLTTMEEIEERMSWLYTKVQYTHHSDHDPVFQVWLRDHDDRMIDMRHDGVPVNWTQFVLATPRDVELAKILTLDWALEEENAFNDLLCLLEKGGFPDGRRTD